MNDDKVTRYAVEKEISREDTVQKRTRLPGSVQEISISVMYHTRENRSRLTITLKISLNKSDCRYSENHRKDYEKNSKIE